MEIDMDYRATSAKAVARALERIAKGLRDGSIREPVRVVWSKKRTLRVVYETMGPGALAEALEPLESPDAPQP